MLPDGCRREGLFEALGARLAGSAGGEPRRLLAAVFAVAAGALARSAEPGFLVFVLGLAGGRTAAVLTVPAALVLATVLPWAGAQLLLCAGFTARAGESHTRSLFHLPAARSYVCVHTVR